MEPEELFYLAQELAGRSTSKPVSEEAKLRSSISRAYYSAFLKVRDFLNEYTSLRVPKDPTGHAFVRNVFYGSQDGKWKKIAYALDSLIARRTKADYGDNIPTIAGEADFCLFKAAKAISLLNDLIKRAK